MFWIYFLFTIVCDVLAFFLSKKYVLTGESIFYWAALLCFVCMGWGAIEMMQFKSMTLVNILWVAGATITISFVGLAYFKEELSFLQFVGIGVVVLGLVLIQWGEK